MRKRTAIGTLIVFALALLACAVCAAPKTERDAASAALYRVNSFVKPAEGLYFTGEEDVTFSVFINKEVYVAPYLQIRYQRVKLNSVVDQVSQNAGKAVGNYEVLDDEVRVEKEDLIVPNENADANYAYFDVKTRVNCAWIFTVIYRAYNGDEEHSECSSDVLYCTRIDNAAPTVQKGSTITRSDGYKITVYVKDNSSTVANSGITEVNLYKRTSGTGEADEKIDARAVAATTSYEYVTTVQSGMVSYYLQAIDRAGNDTGKVLIATFSDQTYDVDAETLAQFALAEFETVRYVDSVVDPLVAAYYEYIPVTRDATSTEAEKQAALKTLKQALQTYTSVRTAFQENGNKIDVTVTDSDGWDTLTVSGEHEALAFLKIGDEAEITVTATKSKVTKRLASVAELKEYKKDDEAWRELLADADVVYAATIVTTSKSEFTLRRQFERPLVLKTNVGAYTKLKATQKVVSTAGNVSYYDCLVIEYADGSVAVEAPQSGGTVYLVADTGENKEYTWLFYLLPVPLVPGIVLLAYGLIKAKKVKEKALAERENAPEGVEEAGSEPGKKGADKKVPPKNKKKKK